VGDAPATGGPAGERPALGVASGAEGGPGEGAGERTLLLVTADSGPVINGVLDEECWKSASTTADFVQFTPNEGMPATLPTRVLVTGTPSAICVGFRCDLGSRRAIARSFTRDFNLLGDDTFTLLLHDSGSTDCIHILGVNALGIRSDGQAIGAGLAQSFAWDPDWQAATREHEGYWEGEIRIPLRSLDAHGFRESLKVNFLRHDATLREVDVWSPTRGNLFDASIYGRLVRPPMIGIRSDSQGTIEQWLRLTPIGYAALRHTPESGSSGARWRGGGDLLFTTSGSLSGVLSYRPDFAEIEADPYTFSLSTDEIYLEEKRPFFLSAHDLFQQPLRTFYSRRIRDIRAAAGLRYRGSAGEGMAEVIRHAPGRTALVLRGQTVALGDATLGGTLTRWDAEDARETGWSADGRLTMAPGMHLVGQVAGLAADQPARLPDQPARLADQPAGLVADQAAGSTSAAYGAWHRKTANSSLEAGYEILGRRFRPVAGFVPYTNHQGGWCACSRTFHPRSGFRSIDLSANGGVFRALDGARDRESLALAADFLWRGGANLRFGWDPRTMFRLGETPFDNHGWEVEVAHAGSHLHRPRLSYRHARFYGGTLDTYSAGLVLTPGRTVRLSLYADRYDLSGHNRIGQRDTWLPGARAGWRPLGVLSLETAWQRDSGGRSSIWNTCLSYDGGAYRKVFLVYNRDGLGGTVRDLIMLKVSGAMW